MIVEDVMATPVISVEPSATVAEAARLMLADRISGLPVTTRDGTLVGMISEGDLLRRGELGTDRKRSSWLEFLVGPGTLADEYVRTHGRKVEQVMSGDPVTTRRDAPLEEVVTAMGRHGIKRLPVLESRKVVGIVARSDVLRALARTMPTNASYCVTDDRIREAVLVKLDEQKWGSKFIRVRVENGVVTLTGTIFDERERQAAKVVAENVPGVKAVVDQIAWIEPFSGMVVLPEESGTHT
ncbi:CBS domain-containing protein [Microvirga lotononidis]|uniref:Putative signal-transduction protein containing cAMP-binding and CBS domains n=1 Tax=Microvirga lotononidis TaxID=864069 RepID=I4Z210_9HYPH|nr:CBS domain-containing protein [Microvirga lotononidis]EIM30252.1 putative signal-transduction protein containing cAMP-binding and CBS domains [Microvirga lotononidis]WQO31533.1 CBS domain-containing protein [Microvirga lotononidis]